MTTPLNQFNDALDNLDVKKQSELFPKLRVLAPEDMPVFKAISLLSPYAREIIGLADKNMRTDLGLNAVHVAAQQFTDPMVIVELQHSGYDFNAVDNRGMNPLMHALMGGPTSVHISNTHYDKVEFMVANGCEVNNVKDKYGDNILVHAAQSNPEMLPFLIKEAAKNGQSMSFISGRGKNIFDILDTSHPEIAEKIKGQLPSFNALNEKAKYEAEQFNKQLPGMTVVYGESIMDKLKAARTNIKEAVKRGFTA